MIVPEPQYRRFLFASTASRLGDALLPLATAFAVLETGGTASQLAIVLVASRIATPLLVLIGGVIGDMASRLAVMRYADLSRLVFQLATGAAFLTLDMPSLWIIALLQFLSGAAAGFFEPAANGYLPSLVHADQLQTANSWLTIFRNSSGIVAQPIAAFVVVMFAPGAAFCAAAVTYAVSFLLLLRLATDDREPTASVAPATIWRQLVEGFRYLRANRWILVATTQLGLMNAIAMGPLFVLGPVVAEASMGGAAGWATIMLGFGIGSLLGGVGALKLHPRRPLLFALGLAALSVPMLFLLGHEPSVAQLAPLATLSGAQGSITNIVVMTEIQQRVPMDALSRTTSVVAMASLVMLPLGMAAAGYFSDQLGTTAVLVGAGALVLVSTATACVTPSVRRLTRLASNSNAPDRSRE